jgi:hypothetical protein
MSKAEETAQRVINRANFYAATWSDVQFAAHLGDAPALHSIILALCEEIERLREEFRLDEPSLEQEEK